MDLGLSKEQALTVTVTTLSNAAELAAGIAMAVLNDQFYKGKDSVPTMDVVRQACIDRIQLNHKLN